VQASGTFPPTEVNVGNQFGAQTYRISQRREFCVPTSEVPVYGSPARAFLTASGDFVD
jgi:hypothetical protein